MVDRQVWIHRQSVSVCVLNNELTFTRFYIRARRAFSWERGKKGIEEKERGATESGGVGWDIIPPRAPSRGGWARTNNHWLAKGVKDRKRRVSPQCRHSLIPAQDRIERIALVCVCACGSWDLLVTSGGPGQEARREPNNINWDYQRPKRVLVMVRQNERDWLTHRQEKHSIGTTETQKTNEIKPNTNQPSLEQSTVHKRRNQGLWRGTIWTCTTLVPRRRYWSIRLGKVRVKI